MANFGEEEVTTLCKGEDVGMDLQNVSSQSTESSLFSKFYKAHRYAPGEAVKTCAELELFYSSGFKVSRVLP